MAPPGSPVPESGDINEGWKIIVMDVGLVAVPVVFVALRFITRKFLAKCFWWDDWIILAALVSSRLALTSNAMLIVAGRSPDRVCTEFCDGLRLWFGKTSIFSPFANISAIQKVSIRTMCAIHLDYRHYAGIDMPSATANPHLETATKAALVRDRGHPAVKFDPSSTLDISMYARPCDVEKERGREVFE